MQNSDPHIQYISRRLIPKVLDNDSFDGSKPLHSARRSVPGDLVDRPSTATTPMGGFEPPSAGCFCPPAALRAAYGTSATAQPAPVWRTKSIRSNGSLSRTFGITRVWTQFSQHLIAKSCTIDKKLMAFFSNRVASLRISFILQKKRSTILRMA